MIEILQFVVVDTVNHSRLAEDRQSYNQHFWWKVRSQCSTAMFQIIRNKMIAGSLRSPPLRQRVSKRGDVFSLLALTFKGVNLFFFLLVFLLAFTFKGVVNLLFLVLVYFHCFRLLSKTLTFFCFHFKVIGIYQIFFR